MRGVREVIEGDGTRVHSIEEWDLNVHESYFHGEGILVSKDVEAKMLCGRGKCMGWPANISMNTRWRLGGK